MNNHQPEYQSLIELMPELKKLDQLRSRSRRMRDRLLKEVVNSSWLGELERRFPGEGLTPTTQVLFRRAKQLAWSLGIFSDCDKDPPEFPRWPPVTLDNLLGSDPERMPIFFATQFIRARLGNLDGGYFTKDCARCYFAIVREIYSITLNKPTVGSITASGDTSEPTAFLAGECSRAMNQLAAGLRGVSEFMSRADEIRTRRANVHELLSIPAFGNATLSELAAEADIRLHASLSELIESRVDSIFLSIPDETTSSKSPERAFYSCLLKILKSLVEFSARSYKSLREVASEVKKVAAPRVGFPQVGHQIAGTALEEACDRFKNLSQEISSAISRVSALVELPLSDWSADQLSLLNDAFGQTVKVACRELHRLQRRVGIHLRFLTHSCEYELYRAQFMAETGSDQRALEDLVFAADIFGSATGEWDHPIFAKIGEVVETHLDHLGQLPRGRPFARGGGGGLRFVSTPHVIRAFAHILQHVPFAPRIETIEKLVRHFEWCMHPSRKATAKDRAIWHAAVSCISLNRVQAMLSARLNRSIKACFNTRTPQDLAGVHLEHLMWSDVGITKVLRASQGDTTTKSIHESLCAMKAALSGTRPKGRRADRIHSILLYGPPGTGKSTLLESLAITSHRDLVVVSPGDFIFEGMETLERQASCVMEALGMLSGTIILFDEFETMIEVRDQESRHSSVLDFLTGNMLPKLSRLNQRAHENDAVYAAATNFVGKMDPAAIREKRFDRKVCVFFPDACSRLLRLLRGAHVHYQGKGMEVSLDVLEHALETSAKLAYASTAQLANLGLFATTDWIRTSVGSTIAEEAPGTELNGAAPDRNHILPTTGASPNSLDSTLPSEGQDEAIDELTLERDLVVTVAGYLEGKLDRQGHGAIEVLNGLANNDTEVVKAISKKRAEFDSRRQRYLRSVYKTLEEGLSAPHQLAPVDESHGPRTWMERLQRFVHRAP